MDWILLGLATWRLTSLLVNEEGPWDMLARIRHWLGVRYDQQSNAYGLNMVARALTCVWCASMWVAAFWVCLYLIFPMAKWIAMPFALSAAAIMIERLVDGPF